MKCSTQLLNFPSFGRTQQITLATHYLDRVRSIAIGPNSHFDGCKISGAGETIFVTRERPYIGELSGKQFECTPIFPTAHSPTGVIAVDEGSTGLLQLQVFDYAIPPFETKRSPLVQRTLFRNVTIATFSDKLIVLGRDQIFVAIECESSSSGSVNAYIRGYTMADPDEGIGANNTATVREIMPTDLRTGGNAYSTLAAGESLIAAIETKGLDAIRVLINPATTGDATSRIEAYDR